MPSSGRRTGSRKGLLAVALAAAAVGGCQCQQAVPTAPPGEVFIPGGTFRMGHAAGSGTPVCIDQQPGDVLCNDFAPVHEVTLSPYFLDTYEVTFEDYKKCMGAGFCGSPWVPSNLVDIQKKKAADPHYAKYPIYGVTPEAAERYCEWKGERLPTEAEWERAARGPNGYDYPWGNAPPTCALEDDWAQGCSPAGSDSWMRPVGSDPRDVSAEGAHDLYGNAFEIVGDLFRNSYYSTSPNNNPMGPKPSDFPPGTLDPPPHTVRGRCDAEDWPSYDYGTNGCPLWFRTWDHDDAGFRCAKDATTSARVPLYRGVTWRRLR